MEHRWGIIGLGDVVQRKSGAAFFPAASEGEAESPPAVAAAGTTPTAVGGVCQRSREHAEAFAVSHGLPASAAFVEPVELLRDPQAAVSRVYIATPPGSHLEVAALCAEHGKPTLVEKPLGRNVAEAQKLMEAFAFSVEGDRAALHTTAPTQHDPAAEARPQESEKQPVPLFVAFYRRGIEKYRALKDTLLPALGDLSVVNYKFLAPEENFSGWRFDPAVSGGGLFVDIASHCLDLFAWFFGDDLELVGSSAYRTTPIVDVRHAGEQAVRVHLRTAAGVDIHAMWDFSPGIEEAQDEFFVEAMDGTTLTTALMPITHPIVVDSTKSEARKRPQPESEKADDGEEPADDGGEDVVVTHTFEEPPSTHTGIVAQVHDYLTGRSGGHCPCLATNTLRVSHLVDEILSAYYGGREDAFWERSAWTWPGAAPWLPTIPRAATAFQAHPAPSPGPTSVMFVGTYTQPEPHVTGRGCGIYPVFLDEHTGHLHPAGEALICAPNPTYLAVVEETPDTGTGVRSWLVLAVTEGGDRDADGSLAVFRSALVGADNDGRGGRIESSRLGSVCTQGRGACHISVCRPEPGDDQQLWAMVAHYHEGTVTLHKLDQQNHLPSTVLESVCLPGDGSKVVPDRQGERHAHSVYFDRAHAPSVVLACDLGNDMVDVYGIDLNATDHPRLANCGSCSMPPGSGPRHMAQHPKWPEFWACLGELSRTVTVLEMDPAAATGGARRPLVPVESVELDVDDDTNLPAPPSSSYWNAAAIAWHPSGRHLYCSVRGLDCICVLRVTRGCDGDGFGVYVTQRVHIGGRTPREISVHPSGQWLIAAGQDSHTLVTFRINVPAEDEPWCPCAGCNDGQDKFLHEEHNLEIAHDGVAYVPSPVCIGWPQAV